jgi:hypothetical protein
MRAFLLVSLLSLTGCLFGASRGQTTTAYVQDDGIHPVQRTTVTQTSSGATVGGTLPLIMGGGGTVMPGMYGTPSMVGGVGTVGGGGNTACVLHPDRCAAAQIATVYQPVSISSIGGYGGVGGNGMVTGVGGGRTSMVGPGGAGTYAETDDAELTAMLTKHEKAISAIAGGTKQNSRQICQILVANPDILTDADERKDVIAGCKDYLSKHPYTPTPSTPAKEAK